MKYYIKSLFCGIQDELQNHIADAKDEIIIAVAWFTNRSLYDIILLSLKSGVACKCILHDDIINRSIYNLDFSEYIALGGELRFYSSDNGLMHNKFCIIDNAILYIGSYNWTYAAEYKNQESVIATTDATVCADFRSHFDKLWESLPSINSYNPMSLSNVFDASFQNVKNELRLEYGIMAEREIICGEILHKLDVIKGLTSSEANINQKISIEEKRILKYDLGMRCRVDGKDNQTLKIARHGSSLPIVQSSVRYTNIPDFPTDMTCELLLGNNECADDNITLCKLVNDGIPRMEAGKLDMRAVVDVDSSGYIKLSNICMNNKYLVTTSILAPEIVEISDAANK